MDAPTAEVRSSRPTTPPRHPCPFWEASSRLRVIVVRAVAYAILDNDLDHLDADAFANDNPEAGNDDHDPTGAALARLCVIAVFALAGCAARRNDLLRIRLAHAGDPRAPSYPSAPARWAGEHHCPAGEVFDLDR